MKQLPRIPIKTVIRSTRFRASELITPHDAAAAR